MTFHLYEGGPLDGRWHEGGSESGDRFYHHAMQDMDGNTMRFTYARVTVRIAQLATYCHWKLMGESLTRWNENKEKLL